MYFKNILLLSLLLILPSLSFSKTPQEEKNSLAVFYEVDGNIEKKYNNFILTKVKDIGFNLTDPHRRVNDQYEVKYGSTVLTLLSFMPVVNDATILPLLNIEPKIAGFAPFNMLIYKKNSESKTYIGHLQPKVMLDILNINNSEVREKFTQTFTPLNNLIQQEFNSSKSYISYKKIPENSMINFEYSFEEPEDIDDFVEEFQNNIELAFINKGYLIAGFHDFMNAPENEDDILSPYDAFWTYSLCHLEFSYHMFDDNQGARPEAGLFAPCTMYMYIKKGSNKIVVGMYKLQNWSDTLDIKDKKRVSLITKLDNEIPKILTEYGMRNTSKITNSSIISDNIKVDTLKTSFGEFNIVLPKVPHAPSIVPVPKVVAVPKIPVPLKPIYKSKNDLSDRSIKFSTRVPPNYVPHSFDKKLEELKRRKANQNTRIGEVTKGFLSAYLRGEYLTPSEANDRLKKAGFTILASVPINKKKTLISTIFTNDTLTKLASKKERGFASTLRLLIDTKKKSIHITNPLYIAKGFLQEDYQEKEVKKILYTLLDTFPKLKNSKDGLRAKITSTFHFMKGMPYYKEMLEVASGEDLLQRVKNNKYIAYEHKLLNGSTVVGVILRKRAQKFPRKIGRENAGLLPYPVLIEDNQAKILNPKYYIAYMYPFLTMTKFMTISTVPDAIYKGIQRVFRKK